MSKVFVVFDLDDTLYKEIDYYKSGVKFLYRKYFNKELITSSNELKLDYNWLDEIIQKCPVSKELVLNDYRTHPPAISLSNEAKRVLQKLRVENVKMSLVTDGRSITQRNKIRALEISSYFERIIISEEIGTEKPNHKNFFKAIENYKCNKFIYVADNPKKDFLGPNELGWVSICLLDDGQNIHPQNFNLDKSYLPKFTISSIKELLNHI